MGRGWHFVPETGPPGSGLAWGVGSGGFCSAQMVGAVWGHQRPHTAPNTPGPAVQAEPKGFGPTWALRWP